MASPDERKYYRKFRMILMKDVPTPPTVFPQYPSAAQRFLWPTLRFPYTYLPDAVRMEFRTLTPVDAPGNPGCLSHNSAAPSQALPALASNVDVDISDSESTDTAPWIRRVIPQQWEDNHSTPPPRQRRLRIESETPSPPERSDLRLPTAYLTPREGTRQITTAPRLRCSPAAPQVPRPLKPRPSVGPSGSVPRGSEPSDGPCTTPATKSQLTDGRQNVDNIPSAVLPGSKPPPIPITPARSSSRSSKRHRMK